MKFPISKVNKDFASSIAKLEEESFSDPWLVSDIENEFNNNPFAVFYVVFDDKTPIGYLEVMVTFDSSSICRIAVLPSYRKQGLGSALLEYSFSDLKTLDEPPSTMTLEVRKDNEAAIKLYEKMGFICLNIKKGYYKDGEDALYMVKGL